MYVAVTAIIKNSVGFKYDIPSGVTMVDQLLLAVFAKDQDCNYLHHETFSHFDTMKGFMFQVCDHLDVIDRWVSLQ